MINKMLGSQLSDGSPAPSSASQVSMHLHAENIARDEHLLGSVVAANPFPFSGKDIILFMDILSAFLLCLILGRTYVYVSRRRQGRVGPSMAPLLLKMWALYGCVEFATQILSMYLIPFRAEGYISFLRATVLLFLASGRRLYISERIYGQHLCHFYDAHSHEIEQYLEKARHYWQEISDTFQQLANILLKRVAVGGLANAVTFPSAPKPEEEQPATQQTEPGLSASNNRMPQETAVFSTGRNFYAGDAQPRAEALASSRTKNVGALAQTAPAEPPRAAYENARALRQKFRRRLSRDSSDKEA